MKTARTRSSALLSDNASTAAPGAAPSRISVLIPTWNEADFIVGVLDTVLTATPRIDEVIVADGGSVDTTCELVRSVARRDPRVVLIDNPARIQSAGVNRAVAAANPANDVIIRLDAHSSYPADFFQRLMEALDETGAASVVVRLRSVGRGCFQRAVAVLSNTILGTGGAAHRMGGKSGFVDHGHHAAFRRSAYEKAGGYDESFVAAEDVELDHRLRDQGGKIWFAADIVVDYFPRDTARRLAKQYYRNGVGRAQAVRKNNDELRIRQVIPPVALLVFVFGLIGAPFNAWAGFLPAAYLLAMALVSAGYAIAERDLCLLAGAIALPIMHMTWAAGFLRSFLFGPPGDRQAGGATAA
jgi:succinoglycan biosynthesis protein ExoA